MTKGRMAIFILRWGGVGAMSVRERGFTLLELMVVLAVSAVIVAFSTPNYINELNQRRADNAAAETQLIIDAARSFRMAKGVWPGDATCSNALSALSTGSPIYLAGISNDNKFNQPYSTSCTATTFSLDQLAVEDWDGYLANSLAATEIVNAGTHQVRTTIGIPGSEPALDAKLSRVATGNAELNRMRTDLLLGGNNIREINDLTAKSGSIDTLLSEFVTVAQSAILNGTLTVAGESQFASMATFKDSVVLDKVVVANTVCSPNGALARNATGAILSCQSGRWSGIGTSGEYGYFASATCPSGWVAANGANGTVDLRGEFIRSLDSGRGVDAGRSVASAQAEMLKAHTHTGTTTTDGYHAHGYTSSAVGGGGSIQVGNGYTNSYTRSSTEGSGAHSHTLIINATGGTETRPRNVALLACMKI